jgi:hypothetical protein
MHRFKVGESVQFGNPNPFFEPVSSWYVVMEQLPGRDGELQYRLKNKHEPYLRMAKESELKAVGESSKN